MYFFTKKRNKLKLKRNKLKLKRNKLKLKIKKKYIFPMNRKY